MSTTTQLETKEKREKIKNTKRKGKEGKLRGESEEKNYVYV